ncbi:MAG: hypothetical protein JO001_10075 [Alphaproteobacteria bacterium]|nr:hypothetical protein [Alphaproteobacteria bacterium]
MRVYLAAHAAKQHERQFGWKNFRVLVITTDWERAKSMIAAAREAHPAHNSTLALFFFTILDGSLANPLGNFWTDGLGQKAQLA